MIDDLKYATAAGRFGVGLRIPPIVIWIDVPRSLMHTHLVRKCVLKPIFEREILEAHDEGSFTSAVMCPYLAERYAL